MILVRGGRVRAGRVRAVEYEMVPKHQAPTMGLRGTALEGELHTVPELGVLRCLDHRGKKLTIVGAAAHVRRLLNSGQASSPDGIALAEHLFPFVVNGWLVRAS